MSTSWMGEVGVGTAINSESHQDSGPEFCALELFPNHPTAKLSDKAPSEQGPQSRIQANECAAPPAKATMPIPPDSISVTSSMDSGTISSTY